MLCGSGAPRYKNPSVCVARAGFVTDMREIEEGQPYGGCLTTETVEGAALSLQSVDDVERRDGLALGVLGVCDGVTDDTLEEGLQDTTGLLVDHCCGVSGVFRDALVL